MKDFHIQNRTTIGMLSVSNRGTVSHTFSISKIEGPQAGSFSMHPFGLEQCELLQQELRPGAICIYMVFFDPQEVGEHRAEVSVSSDDTTCPLISVDFYGSAVVE